MASEIPARGLVYTGLREPRPGSICGEGLFEVVGEDGQVLACTHGPDPGPLGVDVRAIKPLGVHESDSNASVPCVGNGTSGYRVQAIYAHPVDKTDRYESVAPLIRTWAAEMNQDVATSAAKTGGERGIRFVTETDCDLAVEKVTLSSAGDDSFANTISELRDLGFEDPERRYLVWMDSSVLCGIGSSYADDKSSPDNANNGLSWGLVARIDAGCWGRSDHLTELHELMHTFGAVQKSAPNSTAPGAHCTDEYDLMCYRDDGGGGPMRYLCPQSHERLLDCNDDDYFHTSPEPGSYLDTHWNTANSTFLIGAPPILTVTIGGDGGGLVTSDPTGIQCADLCRQWFDKDANVTLLADPDPGSYVAGWEGSDCMVPQPCIVRDHE